MNTDSADCKCRRGGEGGNAQNAAQLSPSPHTITWLINRTYSNLIGRTVT